MLDRPAADEGLPPLFRDWFRSRGWEPRVHQLELIAKARAGRSALLIAPTGAGKTLAGFLPSLIELSARGARPAAQDSPLHTLYVSPLKALAVDIARNLDAPVSEMNLNVRVETRTGDTNAAKRQRQRIDPPDILLTTPEQIALLLSHRDAAAMFAGLKRVIVDELHAMVTSKRGDLLSLGLARLRALAPQATFFGLSATVREPDQLRRWLAGSGASKNGERENKDSQFVKHSDAPSPPLWGRVGEGGEHAKPADDISPPSLSLPHKGGGNANFKRSRIDVDGASKPSESDASVSTATMADLVTVAGGARARIGVLETKRKLPLAGHTSAHAINEVYAAIKTHKITLIFVNTRMQAEFMFQSLWTINEDILPIALHHGSLDAQQRRKVEAAMAAGKLRGVVCTSTLDLGIDWGDVDLVINIGAPKGASRLMQRVGRSNHRMDEPSLALLAPSNRFESLECRVALDAVAEAAQDTPDISPGAFDVLAQHVLGVACGEPFDADTLYNEVRSALPYAALKRADFDRVVEFVATGGYALKSYDRFAKIGRGKDGLWRVSNPRVAQQYRMNVGTIVEAAMLKVRLGRIRARTPGLPGGKVAMGGRVLGEIEEYFAETMTPGDTFIFAGEVLRFEGVQENEVIVTRTKAGTDPKVPSYGGGKFPLSTFLAARVRALLADPAQWKRLPPEVKQWLEMQKIKSIIPKRTDMLVETFPRGGKYYMACFPFEGRLAHQTLGMLLTRRLERARLKPLGFVCNDYGLSIWGVADLSVAIAQKRLDLGELFSEDMLGDDLEDWLAESALMKRTFRNCAIIAGLVERRSPGQEKTGRQVTISTDLVYDVLRRHEPDHILLRAARADAATGLLDVRRLADMLARVKNHIVHRALDHVSPLGVSVMLEIGREAVYGESSDAILAEAEEQLWQEASA
ncbi:ligase-associated DNA damage response DEXH box helicase [Terrarubrum flagellatum]|uniref:ligase-associated DNA damage response DEXH box helicase n=1 Tax=Terrirubrum flagellatum TaxID=2895980 RepID=UPI0031453B53